MKAFKIFGLSVQLAKGPAKSKNIALDSKGDKKRATGAIRKMPKREVSFQIADIKRALTSALNTDMPDRTLLYEIYRYIIRDGRLKSQMRTAKIKVKSEPWLLYRNGNPDDKASELFRTIWMSRLIEAIIEAEFYGFRVVELTLDNEGEGMIKEVSTIENQFVSIERQWILIEGTFNGPYLPYGDIAWDMDLLEFGKRDDLGSLLESSYNVLWKFYARSDWSRYSEKVGTPILNVQANTNNDKELDDIEARAANFGSDGYIVTQSGDIVTMIERKNEKGHSVFMDNIAYCDEEISHLVNGQTATSATQAWSGSSQVQERTMEDYTTDRLQNICDEMNGKVFPYLAAKGFPVEGLVFDYPELVRTRERRKTGQPLATDPKAPTDQPTDASAK